MVTDIRKKAMDDAAKSIQAMNNPEYQQKSAFIYQAMRHQELDDVKWKGVKWLVPYLKVLENLTWIENYNKKTWKHGLNRNQINLWNYCFDKLKQLNKPHTYKRKVVPA